MPLEALKTITDAEESARHVKAQAAAKAKQMISDAEKAGEETLRLAKEKAVSELEMQRLSLKQKGEAKASEQSALLEKQKSELRAAAQSKLDDAAGIIVERIVNG